MAQVTSPQIDKPPTRAAIEQLCALTEPYISILLPGYRPGGASTPETVPLKHPLRTAVDFPAIKEMGQEGAALLGQLHDLADPELEWGREGLALFCAHSSLRASE